MSDEIENGQDVSDELTLADAESAAPVRCPTCGAMRGGSAGSPHGCSTVPTMISPKGGVIYAPASATCNLCGSKEHRNLPKHERTLICLWQQFSADTFGSAVTITDRHGQPSMHAEVNSLNASEFAAWLAAGKARVKSVRRGRPTKGTVTAVATVPTAATVATVVGLEPSTEATPSVAPAKPKKLSKAERMKRELERMAEERERGLYR